MRIDRHTSVLLALFACGCGVQASPPSPTIAVKGKVTYQGKPLSQGTVTFEPDSGREAHGTIQPDGTFVLSTFKQGDGAIAGTHRVAVSGTGNGNGREVVPTKYKNTSSSKIEVEVSEGKADYPIDLK